MYGYEPDWGFRIFIGVAVLVVGSLVTWGIVELVSESTEPTSGTITQLEYVPESSTIVCTSAGKTTVCTPVTSDECYSVTYEADGNTGDDCTSKERYETLAVGEHYSQD